MAHVELRNVTYRYPFTKQNALENVTFSFEKGRLYGVTGRNGAGKTSLCNIIRGLIPHFYKGELHGDVLIDGTDVRQWDTGGLSAKIGYVFQNPFTQISGIKKTVFEEVAVGLENMGVEKREMIRRTLDVCEMLGLTELLEHNPCELSGGQRQRVAFASVIAMDLEMYVIDEPTSQLDPQSTEEVFEIIGKLKQSGKTIVLAEHKVDHIARCCDEVLVMDGGRLALTGSAAGVLASPSLASLGAGAPEAAKFGRAMAQAGKPLESIPITIEQAARLVRDRRRGATHGH